jgi:hypothetical protein
MTEKWKLTSDQKAIGQMIGEIGGTSKRLRELVNTCAMSCVWHAVEHGNATPASSLCEKLGEGWRLDALREWFIAYGPFKWNADKRSFYLNKDKLDEYKSEISSDLDTFLGRMESCPFWQFKPEPSFVGFDLEKELKKLRAKAEKAEIETDESRKAKIRIKPEHIDKFKEFVATLG